jgi:hypothetical protein
MSTSWRRERFPSGLARRASRIGAPGRLETELRSIALDLLGMNESRDLPAVGRDWVARATEQAVSTVRDAALDALVTRLDSLLAGAPPQVARDLDRAKARMEAGYD